MNSHTLDFITKLLKDTMRIDFHYFIEPYNDFSNFDRFLRESLLDSHTLYDEIIKLVTSFDHKSFHVLTDCYQLNYVIFYPFEQRNDLITIGPYFNEEITETYWNELTKIHKLTLTNVQKLKGFLYGVPVAANNLQLISTTSTILQYMNPDTTPFSVQYHDTNVLGLEQNLYQPKNDFEAYSSQIAIKYELEQQLHKHISNGNYKGALEVAQKFLSLPSAPRVKNSLRDHKLLLIAANTLFRKAVEVNEIHPIYLHEISSKFVNLIENVTALPALNTLYEKMIRDYCFLVKNKSTKQYSPIVRQTLYYIEFNLNNKINLSEIAKNFGVSIPYLSSQFKKEVGETIIQYTNILRINTAIKLLNTSSLTIQDIASHVGIYDYNYFTKVFKKEIGLTPTEYRKQLYPENELKETLDK